MRKLEENEKQLTPEEIEKEKKIVDELYKKEKEERAEYLKEHEEDRKKAFKESQELISDLITEKSFLREKIREKDKERFTLEPRPA